MFVERQRSVPGSAGNLESRQAEPAQGLTFRRDLRPSQILGAERFHHSPVRDSSAFRKMMELSVGTSLHRRLRR